MLGNNVSCGSKVEGEYGMMMAVEKRITLEITEVEMTQYRHALAQAMLAQGADLTDIELIKDATIRNSIRAKRKPEDVAWALLQ